MQKNFTCPCGQKFKTRKELIEHLQEGKQECIQDARLCLLSISNSIDEYNAYILEYGL